MLKEKIQNYATLGKWVVFIFVVSTIVNVLWFIFGGAVICLSENQLLYFLSAEAQVIGALFGLTLTAFIFFNDKFVVDVDETDQLICDAVKQLKKRYYQNLTIVSIVVGFAIVVCFIGIVSLNLKNRNLFTLFFTEGILSGFIGLFAVIAFAISLLDPDKKENEMKKISKIEIEGIKAQSEKFATGIDDFVRPYNRMENTIRDWADYCISKTQFIESYRGTVHPNTVYNLRILNKIGIIDSEMQKEIDHIRRFRNIMVHSEEQIDVPQKMCDRLKKINVVLEDAFKDFKNRMESVPEADIYDTASFERKYIRDQLKDTIGMVL